MVAGDNTKTFLRLNFVGTDFQSSPIGAAAMTCFYLDVRAPTGADSQLPDGWDWAWGSWSLVPTTPS